MECPKCFAQKTTVKDSRPTPTEGRVKRKRQCSCGHRFSTLEILDGGPPSCAPEFLQALRGRINHIDTNVIGIANLLEHLHDDLDSFAQVNGISLEDTEGK